MRSKRRSSLRFCTEVNEAISSVMLNKICLAEGLAFNLCISLNHFIVFENTEREISQSRNVCLIESELEQRLQWSSVAMLNFSSSSLVMIILSSILNKNNCLNFCNLIYLGKPVSPVKKTVMKIFFQLIFYSGGYRHRALIK